MPIIDFAASDHFMLTLTVGSSPRMGVPSLREPVRMRFEVLGLSPPSVLRQSPSKCSTRSISGSPQPIACALHLVGWQPGLGSLLSPLGLTPNHIDSGSTCCGASKAAVQRAAHSWTKRHKTSRALSGLRIGVAVVERSEPTGPKTRGSLCSTLATQPHI